MTDKEKKSKIADILMDFQEEYSNEVINRPMLASLYAGNILSFIDSLQEEPVSEQNLSNVERIRKNWKEEPISEDLEEAAWFYADRKACLDKSVFTQKEVNEKRSKLEYNWEDIRLAFKAGAERQFERVKEALLSEVLPCFMRGGEADEVVAKLEEVLNQKK